MSLNSPNASSGNPAYAFWRVRRPLRSMDPLATRGRSRSSGHRLPWTKPAPITMTVKMEVEKFKFYGKLRRTHTDVHNSLPSSETIQTEKTLMDFEESRRSAPESTMYEHFYRALTSSITPLPLTSSASARDIPTSSRLNLSSRATVPETPKSTVFTLFPHLPQTHNYNQQEQQQGQLGREGSHLGVSNKKSVVARLVTSYGRRSSRGLLDDLRPATSTRSLPATGRGVREGFNSFSSRGGPREDGDGDDSSLFSPLCASRDGAESLERPSCGVLGPPREEEVISSSFRDADSRNVMSREVSRGGSESEPNSQRFFDVGGNMSSLSSRI